MDSRSRLLGIAALAFGGGFAFHAVEYAVRVANVLDGPHPGAAIVADSLAIVQYLVLLLASFFAAQAFFFPPEEGRRGLRDAALLATAGYGFGVLAAAFSVQVDLSGAPPHVYVSAAVLDGAFAAVLLLAALLAASALSQPERHERDRRLGWSGLAFMAANLVALTAGVVRSQAYTDDLGLGTLTVGLNLGTASFVAAAAAGAIASFAFFDAARAEGAATLSIARRDLLLAAAAGVYGIFAAIGLASATIVAIANAGLDFSAKDAAPTWLAAVATLGALGAAICLMAALQPAFARALQRLR
jgi:hypothetical protein